MDAKPRRYGRFALIMVPVTAIAGAAGYRIGHQLKAGGVALPQPGWFDGVALTLAASLAFVGLMLLIASLTPKMAAKMVEPTGTRPATKAQTALFRGQGLVLALAGVMLAAPVIVDLLPQALSAQARLILMLGLCGLFAIQSVFNLIVWRRSDEYLRRMAAETSTVCFWLLQGALFLWAAGERLSVLPPISAWEGTVVVMAVYLAASTLISLRRGGAG